MDKSESQKQLPYFRRGPIILWVLPVGSLLGVHSEHWRKIWRSVREMGRLAILKFCYMSIYLLRTHTHTHTHVCVRVYMRSHTLVHSQNACPGQSWARLKSRALNSIWVFHMGDRSPTTWAMATASLHIGGKLETGVEPGLKPRYLDIGCAFCPPKISHFKKQDYLFAKQREREWFLPRTSSLPNCL